MHKVKAEDARKVAYMFHDIAERHDIEVDMGNIFIEHTRDNEYQREPKLCGCHGAIYALATWYDNGDEDTIATFLDHENPALEVISIYTHYKDGAQKLAKALGFKDRRELEIWAEDHPELWGNDGGDVMFLNEGAFAPYHDYEMDAPLTANDLAEHWFKVALNIEREGT